MSRCVRILLVLMLGAVVGSSAWADDSPAFRVHDGTPGGSARPAVAPLDTAELEALESARVAPVELPFVDASVDLFPWSITEILSFITLLAGAIAAISILL